MQCFFLNLQSLGADLKHFRLNFIRLDVKYQTMHDRIQQQSYNLVIFDGFFAHVQISVAGMRCPRSVYMCPTL